METKVANNSYKNVKNTYAEALRKDANVCRLEGEYNDIPNEVKQCRKLLSEGYNIYRLFE